MNGEELRRQVAGTRLESFLSLVPSGAQLPAWASVCAGLKPAMDLWIDRHHHAELPRVARRLGLKFATVAFVDRTRQELDAFPRSAFTTTRAMLVPRLEGAAEAHVVVARSQEALDAATASAWYPVVVDGVLIEKHLFDHVRFGEALGYPECCRRFFRRHDHWHRDNTLYAAWANTDEAPSFLSNSIARHTAYGLVSHLACSFACAETISRSRGILDAIGNEAPAYAAAIESFLCSPMLALSELRLFRFEGELIDGVLRYTSVMAVSPATESDPLSRELRRGDALLLDGAVIRVLRGGRQTGAVLARADHHGPEVPFVVQCH